MSRKRRVFGAPFKAQVALAAVRGDETASELAGKFQMHPSQVMAWKKQQLKQAPELFEDGRRRDQELSSAKEEELYEQIGRVKMEVEWLKKNLPSSVEEKRRWIERGDRTLSIVRQCELLGLSRSGW